MTTLVMVQEDGDVLLGWDSLFTRGNESGVMAEPKFFENGGVIIGIAGPLSGINALRFATLPEYEGQPALRWLTTTWAPAVREVAATHTELCDGEGAATFSMFVVVDGEAFEFDTSWVPYQTMEGIYTTGSGGAYARGALFAGADVMTALRVASQIDPYTGGPTFVTRASTYLGTTQD